MELSREKIYRHWRQRFAWLGHFLKAYLKHKERPRVLRLANYIPAHAVIFDVGAHFGYLAKEFARIHNGTCRVYCFEPVSYTYSILERVMHKFANAKLEFFALSNAKGTLEITIPVKPSGRLGIGLSHFGPEQEWNYITEEIRTERLDDYVAQNGIERLDFIKIDVEGAELLVLQGAENTLRTLRPTVYCEVQPSWTKRLGYAPADLFEFMQDKGYRPHVLHEEGLEAIAGYQEEYEDYLFMPAS